GLGVASSEGLDWDELGGLAASRMEIGAHTRTHPTLDTLTAAAARSEIRGSRAELEDWLGAPVRAFAYPHGYYSRPVRKLTVDARFESAAAVGSTFAGRGDGPVGSARWPRQ